MMARGSTGGGAAQRGHEAAHAGVASGKAMLIDEILPDRHRVAAPVHRLDDELPIRLARAGRGRAAGRFAWRVAVTTGSGRGSRWTPLVVAGFGGGQTFGRPPVRRTGIPAAFKYALAVSRRTPVAASMRRRDQPSRPSARTCCCVCSLKTLLMSGEGPCGPLRRQRLGSLRVLAGFQVSISGRIWVSAEALQRLSSHQWRGLWSPGKVDRCRAPALPLQQRAPIRG